MATAWLSLVLLHYFDPAGCDEWDLRGRPLIRTGMPVLIDEDLRFEDEHAPRPATVINRWLRELPISGAPSPRTWRTYAGVLKAWVEFLDARGWLLMNALAGNGPTGARDVQFCGRETGRNAAVIGLALASGLRAREFTYLTVFEVPPLPARRTPVPVPLSLAPATAKGGRGRSSWIDYDALARVHDYVNLERAATVRGSRWLPGHPLRITGPTYGGALINGTGRRWSSLNPDERLRLVAPGGGSALLRCRPAGGRSWTGPACWPGPRPASGPGSSRASRTCTRT